MPGAPVAAGVDAINTVPQWLFWALLSAMFAALTAIFAKLGLQRVDSDLAMLLRTGVILLVLSMFVSVTGKWRNPLLLPTATLGWLVLSALATGASWICYFRALQQGQASQVASVDKLSVVLVAVFAVAFLNERLAWREWFGLLLIGSGVLLMALKR